MAAMTSDQGRVKTTIITLVLILIPLAAYYFIYIPHQERYFTKRYLRLLADMSKQIQTKIQHFETIFNNAAKLSPQYLPPVSKEPSSRLFLDVGTRMAVENAVGSSVQKAIELVPNLELIHTDIRIGNRRLKEHFYSSHFESIKRDSSDLRAILSNGLEQRRSEERFIASRLEVELQREGQSYWLHFFVETYVYDPARFWQGYTVYVHAKSSLDKVVRPIVDRKIFDDMLLVNSAGNVMFQRNQKELVASRFDSLNTLSGVTLPFNSLLYSSGLYSVHLSGSDYKFFLQPVLFSLRSDRALGANAEMTGSKSQDIASGDVTWGLCGLIRTDLFNSQVRAISYTYIILFVCLLLLVILSLPLIKLWYMGSREKLRIADVLILTITAILGTATLTFLLLDQKEYSRLSQVMDKQLELFADEIENNLLDELTQAYKQLKTFAQQEAIPKDNKGYKTVPNCLSVKEKFTKAYPYFDILALIDSSGEQRVKWTPKRQTTPLIDVSERGYVRYVREKRFWTVADTMQVVLEPIFSWNTGENLVTLSIPKDSKGAVAAMSFRLLSLLKTVVPKGFGFSIIQRNGNVLFHSDENRNLRENFFDECDDNEELKSAVFAHARKSLNAQYRGRGHRLHVTPLANSQWFLIVFRDKKILRTANLEIFAESLTLFLLYVVSFLLLLSLVYMLRSGYRPEWLWPQRTKTVAYRQLIFAYLLVSAIFLVWIFVFSAYQILHTVFLLPPFAVGLAYLKLQHRSKKSTRKRRLTYAGLSTILIILLGFAILLSNDPLSAALKCLGLITGLLASAALLFHPKFSEVLSKPNFPSFREGFVLAMVSLLVLISIIPAVAFYKFAYDEELELLIKHGQLNLSQALDEQKARVIKEVRDIVVSDKDSFMQKRLALHWGVYDTLFFDTFVEEAVQDDCLLHSEEPRRSLFKEFLMKLRPLRSQIAEETRGLIHEASADSGWGWKPFANNRLVLHKESRSEKSARHFSSMIPVFAPHKSFLWWFGLAFILMLIYPLTRYIAKRLFLINLEEPTDLYHEELRSGKITKNLLVLGPPNAGKSKLLKGKPGIHIVDLAKKDSPEDLAKETQFGTKDIVAVDHLEYQIEDANWNHAKFELIRKLLYVHKKTVVVFSTVDPMFYFPNTEQDGNQSQDSKRQTSTNIDRWAVVFSAFLKVYYEEQGDEKRFSQTMDTSILRKKGTDERLLNLYRILQRECKPSANLKRLGLAISELEEFNHLTEEELLGQFLEWAEAYYRAIWATCSKEEKMILNHIARYGFVNSRNHEIVRRLLRRRLIYRDPAFRLMNETFRRFVRSPQIQQEISKWEEQVEASSWSKMKVPVFTVLAAVVVFIFTTQQEVFDTTLTMLSALAAALPALVRLFGFLPIRKAGGDTPQSQTA